MPPDPLATGLEPRKTVTLNLREATDVAPAPFDKLRANGEVCDSSWPGVLSITTSVRGEPVEPRQREATDVAPAPFASS
jgi:hypothetical protein